MKTEEKVRMAGEVVALLDQWAVNDADKKKVISNAWQQVNKKPKSQQE